MNNKNIMPFEEMKTLVINSVKKVNEMGSDTFDAAYNKLVSELSNFQDIKLNTHNKKFPADPEIKEIIIVEYFNEEVANITGYSDTGTQKYTLFEDETQIFFYDDADIFYNDERNEI